MWRTPEGDRILGEAEWTLFAMGVALLTERIHAEGVAGGRERLDEDTFFDRLTAEQKLCELHATARALRLPELETPDHTAANEGAINAAFNCIRGLLVYELDGYVALGDDPRAVRRIVQRAVLERRDSGRGLPLLDSANEDEWLALLEEIEDGVLWDFDWADAPEEITESNGGYFRSDFPEPLRRDLDGAAAGLIVLLGLGDEPVRPASVS